MNKQIERYQRQFLFPEIGREGQERISNSKVLLVGCGALGTHAADMLVRAGVGSVMIVDRDWVELSNLQRQTVFDENDAREGLPKAIAIETKLRRINSEISVHGIVDDLTWKNAEEFVRDVDLVLDATDNFETRFLINDVCVKLGKPWIYAACVASDGRVMFIKTGETPCLHCVFESAPPQEFRQTCETVGILGPLVAMVSSFQSMEAIRFLSGNRLNAKPVMYSMDGWHLRMREIDVSSLRKPDCKVCGRHEFEYLNGEKFQNAQTLCGRNSVQLTGEAPQDLTGMAERLKTAGSVKVNPYLLQFSAIDGYDITLFKNGRTIVKGTNDPAVARSVYARYVGC